MRIPFAGGSCNAGVPLSPVSLRPLSLAPAPPVSLSRGSLPPASLRAALAAAGVVVAAVPSLAASAIAAAPSLAASAIAAAPSLAASAIAPVPSLAASAIATPSLPARAQAIVVPDGLAAVEGDSRHHAPAHYGPNRVQALYRASVLTGLDTRAITRLHLRRDGASPATFAAHAWRVTVHVSSAGVPAPEVSCTVSFTRNRGSDWSRVVDDKVVQWPAAAPPVATPAAFAVAMPFDAPIAYASGRNLLVQWDCATTAGPPEAHLWYVDAQAYAGGDSNGSFTSFGRGCPDARTFGGAAPGPMGGTLSWFWHSGAADGAPAVALLGPADGSWGGITLPFDLAPLGGSGCALYTAVAAALPLAADPTGGLGRVRVDLPVPCNQSFANQAFHVQIAVLDPGFNALRLRVSPAGKAVLGPIPTPLAARLLYSYDTAAAPGRITDVPTFAAKVGLVLGID